MLYAANVHPFQSNLVVPSLSFFYFFPYHYVFEPGRVAQSVARLTQEPEVPGSISVWQHTFVSPSAGSRRTIVSYWRKYMYEVLVNRFEGLSLPWKSVVRLTDLPDMTLDVYPGCKTTTQQQQLCHWDVATEPP